MLVLLLVGFVFFFFVTHNVVAVLIFIFESIDCAQTVRALREKERNKKKKEKKTVISKLSLSLCLFALSLVSMSTQFQVDGGYGILMAAAAA